MNIFSTTTCKTKVTLCCMPSLMFELHLTERVFKNFLTRWKMRAQKHWVWYYLIISNATGNMGPRNARDLPGQRADWFGFIQFQIVSCFQQILVCLLHCVHRLIQWTQFGLQKGFQFFGNLKRWKKWDPLCISQWQPQSYFFEIKEISKPFSKPVLLDQKRL